LATRYLNAIANRNRFSARYGVALADATLALHPAKVTSTTAPAVPAARPGLVRARAAPPPPVDLAAELLAVGAKGRRR
jgi:hypothetical protein